LEEILKTKFILSMKMFLDFMLKSTTKRINIWSMIWEAVVVLSWESLKKLNLFTYISIKEGSNHLDGL